MGRSPCFSKEALNRGAWTALEDKILTAYIKAHGEGKWRNLPKRAGLQRCGKSCRLRWLNYLRPDIKRGNISHDEEELIIRLHKLLGNRWSLIAGRLPGRTDNEIKNYWNTTLGKKANGKSTQSPKTALQTRRAIETKTSSDSSPVQPIRTKAARCPKVVLSPPLIHHIMPENNGIGDAQVDYQWDETSVMGCDQIFHIEEPILNDWTDGFQANDATFDLDSLTSFLNSDEWP